MKNSMEIWDSGESSEGSEPGQQEEYDDENFDPFCKKAVESFFLF